MDRRARERLEQQHLAYEAAAAQAATSRLRSQLQQVTREASAYWVARAGSLELPLPDGARPGLRALLGAWLANVQVDATTQAARAVAGGLDRGVQIAQASLGRISGTPAPSPQLSAVVADIDRSAQQHIRVAHLLAYTMPLEQYRDLLAVLGRAHQAANHAERDIRWAVNRAIAEAVRQAADARGVPRLWVGERDACLHCLAYFGEIAPPGGDFPGGLTYYRDPDGDPKPVSRAPVADPPLHPWCRCRTEPWLGGSDLSAALRREAQRAVLRGTAGSQSEPARLRAADALLRAGTNLPRSVQARSAAAVQAGAFPVR